MKLNFTVQHPGSCEGMFSIFTCTTLFDTLVAQLALHKSRSEGNRLSYSETKS